MARLWRYEFDKASDLVISESAPFSVLRSSRYLPSIDRLVNQVFARKIEGLLFCPSFRFLD